MQALRALFWLSALLRCGAYARQLKIQECLISSFQIRCEATEAFESRLIDSQHIEEQKMYRGVLENPTPLPLQ